MKKTIQLIGVALIWIFATLGCSPDANTNYAEEEIVAEQGGVVVTENGIKLEIPAGAFEEDGVVFIGKTGDEPTTVPNQDLTVVGEPFTLKLPVDTLLAPLTLSFPLPVDDITNNNGIVMLYNGTSYYPFEYEIVDGKVVVTIDKINWEQITTKGILLGPLVVIALNFAVNINDDLLGIKEVSIVSSKVQYDDPDPKEVNSSSKILIFVHGLIGDPKGWEEYVQKIYAEPDRLSYTNIWTFGYDSDLPIDLRGGEFKRLLQQYLNGQNPTIHIVAHSMGGLVSRSMIENHNGASLVHKLITLSTPHLGSPVEVLRQLVGLSTDPNATPIIGDIMEYPNNIYVYNTQAIKDLGEKSKFIEDLKKSTTQHPPYYTIACKNKYFSWSEIFFDSPHDGFVSVISAKGVPGAKSPSHDVIVPVPFPKCAHLNMRTFTHRNDEVNDANEELYAQVKEFLLKNEQEESGTFTDSRDGKVYSTVTIGNQLWMAENLAYLPAVSPAPKGGGSGEYSPPSGDLLKAGPSAAESDTELRYYVYEYSGTNVEYAKKTTNYMNYGVLYNWPAAITACPEGWHLPSDAEWKQLEMYLGMTQVETDKSGYRGTDEGGKLKEVGTSHWRSPNTGATNERGFTGLPGGVYENNYGVYGKYYYSYWWSSTVTDPNYTWYRCLNYNNSKVYRNSINKNYGFSVRCIKDANNSFTDSRDGNEYKTVTIGEQVWMAENLAYLPSVVGPATGSEDAGHETDPYYYVYGYDGTDVDAAKATANYLTYGVLYNWHAALTSCPPGWHLPSFDEWTVLTDYLGGIDVAGGKIKEVGTTHWITPNEGATNQSGFTALPGGWRYYSYENFYSLGVETFFWVCNEFDQVNGWLWGFEYNSARRIRGYNRKSTGYSIRCIRD